MGLGTTRETVTRIFSDFKKRRIIEVKGSSIFVIAKPKLESIVCA